ncbi:MAG: BA14K family protein [Hyphomicrobiales bacterium]|nr:BA14K family protein [Hyphomicrobiales bacterium]
MPKFPFRTTAVAAALLVGALAMSQPAEARSRAPAIIAGIAAGAIIAGIATSHHRRRHYEHPRAYYYAPPPPRRYYAPPVSYSHSYAPSYGHSYAPAPWTDAWYDYCLRKYRSFDPRSGTFQPYHGPRRLCR